MAKENPQETAIVPAIPRPDDDVLRSINSVSDALEMFAAAGIDVRDIADEIGTGFTLCKTDEDKGALVGRPMVLLAWTFTPGDWGQFVTAFAITEDGGKYIINDGGTGIQEQLDRYTEATGRQNAMRVPHGLRRSDYFIDKETKEPVRSDFDGPKIPAVTFYLDTSA